MVLTPWTDFPLWELNTAALKEEQVDSVTNRNLTPIENDATYGQTANNEDSEIKPWPSELSKVENSFLIIALRDRQTKYFRAFFLDCSYRASAMAGIREISTTDHRDNQLLVNLSLLQC